MATATVTAARDVPDEHPAGPEEVAVRAVRRRQRDPTATAVLDQITNAGHH